MPEPGEFVQISQTRVGNTCVFQVEASDPVAMHLCEPGKGRVIECRIANGNVGPFGLSDRPQKPWFENTNTCFAPESFDVFLEPAPCCG